MSKQKKGFTLIELLLALALGALIFIAISSLFISFTQLWIKEEGTDDFEDHINGLSRFLKSATLQEDYAWEHLPGVNAMMEKELLSFVMAAPHPLLSFMDPGPVKCYLQVFDKEGLWLMYHQLYQNELDSQRTIYMHRLSKDVEKIMFYTYYEGAPGKWVEVEDLGAVRKNNLPFFMKLYFSREGKEDKEALVELM